ncbi:MAG: hypothetical protein WDA12_05010 [Bacilli bacterium]
MTGQELLAYFKANAEDESMLVDMFNRAVAAIEKEVDWYFGEPRATEEILDGSSSRVKTDLFIRQYPVPGQPVVISERSRIGSSWSVIPSSNYEFGGNGRVIIHVSFWPVGRRNIRVQYTEGFVSMPGDVQQLALDMVGSRWKSRLLGGGPLKSESLGDYSYTLGDLEGSGRDSGSAWGKVRNNWGRGRI